VRLPREARRRQPAVRGGTPSSRTPARSAPRPMRTRGAPPVGTPTAPAGGTRRRTAPRAAHAVAGDAVGAGVAQRVVQGPRSRVVVGVVDAGQRRRQRAQVVELGRELRLQHPHVELRRGLLRPGAEAGGPCVNGAMIWLAPGPWTRSSRDTSWISPTSSRRRSFVRTSISYNASKSSGSATRSNRSTGGKGLGMMRMADFQRTCLDKATDASPLPRRSLAQARCRLPPYESSAYLRPHGLREDPPTRRHEAA
jgi:hypothetical protein